MARRCSTVCLPFDQTTYPAVVADPAAFRRALDRFFLATPELFPDGFAEGYRLKESRTSRKLGLRLRRVRLKATGEAFTVRPSFALPYMAGWAKDASGPLFLRAFGVPFWALAFVFGRDHGYWYRVEVALGRNSIAGTTLRRADLPEHLLADEHHQPRDGEKNYIATTVGAGCCLGAALAQTAGTEDLQKAYGVFKEEAQDVQPGYAPRTVSVDGWASTHQAWLLLFPLVVLLRCFLHGWLNVRSRGKLNESFGPLSERVWHAYHAALRAADAAAVGVGQGERVGGVAAGAGPEDVRAVGGVREGVRPPRRAPDQQHARPGDARDEPVPRQRPAPARRPGGGRAARAGVGAAAQLSAVAQGGGPGQRRLAVPGGAAQPAPLPRGLAPEPPGLRFAGRLPPPDRPAPNSMTISSF